MKCKALLQSNCEISLPHCIPILFNVFFPDNKSFLSLWIIPSESIVSFSHFASCFLLVASCSLCLASLFVLQNFVLSLSHLHPLSLSVFCWPASILYCVVFCILSSLLTLFCIVLYCILYFVLPVDPASSYLTLSLSPLGVLSPTLSQRKKHVQLARQKLTFCPQDTQTRRQQMQDFFYILKDLTQHNWVSLFPKMS